MTNPLTKKTKIVATIGPVTTSVEMLSRMLKAGMNVMRMNFSHGDFKEHQEKVDNLRKAEKATGIKATVFQDLGGPKIRTGDFITPTITLVAGETVVITTEQIVGDEKKFSINYKPFPKEVQVGGLVMIDDGKKKLEIIKISGHEVTCKVLIGGITKPRRGINLPGAALSIASLTEKDKKDLEFGLKNKVDFIALSFVRRASDIDELRAILKKRKSDAKIIAKVEDQEALSNIDSIIDAADAILIGRGDFAVEIGAEHMPLVQKMIIEKCTAHCKPVITATQMMESMIKNSRPTRAEVSDVATAIWEGSDAVMLSEETTLGDFPVESVEWMSAVAQSIESNYPNRIVYKGEQKDRSTAEAVCAAAAQIAKDISAKLIVVLTHSGASVNLISRYKPQQLILTLALTDRVANQTRLSFGTFPVAVKKFSSLKEVMSCVRDLAKKHNLAQKGDRVVVVFGKELGTKIPTDSIDVETI